MSDLISKQEVINLFKKYQPFLAVRVIEFGDALEQLPAAQPEQKWISCSERMPDNTVPCLVYYREYDVFDGKYRDPDVMILSYIPDAKIWNIKSPVKVSHWMPLPEPPGGDKNGR